MDTYVQPPGCGPQGQEGPSSVTSSPCVTGKPLPSLGLGFPVCPGGACAGGWAGCLHLTRSKPRPSPPRRGCALEPVAAQPAKLPPEHMHHRPRLPRLRNGSVLAPRRHRRERAVETGVARPGRPSSHVRVHLCRCTCVYTEVHTENRCCDKRPPVKMPLPPTHRGDP